jgi:hypothetical protein
MSWLKNVIPPKIKKIVGTVKKEFQMACGTSASHVK